MYKDCFGKLGAYIRTGNKCGECNLVEDCKKDYLHIKVEVKASVTLIGFKLDGETDEQAISRIVLEAEQRINAIPDIRAHFSV